MSQLWRTVQAAPVWWPDERKWRVSGWPGGRLYYTRERFDSELAAQQHADKLNRDCSKANWEPK